jgi:hypothetical protein
MVNRGSDFRVRYRIRKFCFLPLSPPSGRKSRFDFFTGISIVRGLFSSGSVREVFGKASGFPEDFPKKPRRNPENNLSGIRPQILSGKTAKLLQNPRKEKLPYTVPNSEIRFPGAPIFVEPAGEPPAFY